MGEKGLLGNARRGGSAKGEERGRAQGTHHTIGKLGASGNAPFGRLRSTWRRKTSGLE